MTKAILTTLCVLAFYVASAEAQGTISPNLTVQVADSTTIVGLGGGVNFRIESSIPVRLSLRITSLASGQSVLVDSAATGRSAVLTFRPVVTNPARYPSGGYQVVVIGRADDGAESVVKYRAVVVAPRLRKEEVPVAIDPAELTSVRRRPPIIKSLISALVVGGATYAAGTLSRPSGQENASSRGTTLGIALGVLVGVGSQLVESPPDPQLVARNRLAQRQFEEKRALIAGFNDLAEKEYRAFVILTREQP